MRHHRRSDYLFRVLESCVLLGHRGKRIDYVVSKIYLRLLDKKKLL